MRRARGIETRWWEYLIGALGPVLFVLGVLLMAKGMGL